VLLLSPGYLPGLATEWRAVRVQTVSVQRFGHAESVEHAADAVDAETPEGTFTVVIDQLLESVELVRSRRVELEFASFPARPGIGCDPDELGHFGLGPVAECPSQIDQVQIRAAGRCPSIRHV
jgi:hypothetical protein